MASLWLQASMAAASPVVQTDLPTIADGIVTQQVDAAVVTAQLEVAVGRIQPAVDNLGYRYRSPSELQVPRLSVGTVTGVAIDAQDRPAVRVACLVGWIVHRFSVREISGSLIQVPLQRGHLPGMCSL